MKKNILKLILASGASIALLSGCTGSGASPHSGAQAGAVTGAVAGSVIGYNTKGHHKGQRAVIGGLLGAAVGAGVGNAVDQNREAQYNDPQYNNSGWQ